MFRANVIKAENEIISFIGSVNELRHELAKESESDMRRHSDEWGTLATNAYCLIRELDILVKEIDAKRTGV